MSKVTSIAFAAVAAALFCSARVAPAQISISFGVEPVCPYGYYDYAPYNCSPYGYYGPDWFQGGVFIGAGHWFRGPAHFYGHVDNRFDPRHGYHGPYPQRGEEAFNHFHGNEARDGRGHAGPGDHDGRNEHALPGYRGGGDHGGDHRGDHR
ncbi:MAG: hypothetical protein ACLP07_17795 [Terracidiphilus sp.]